MKTLLVVLTAIRKTLQFPAGVSSKQLVVDNISGAFEVHNVNGAIEMSGMTGSGIVSTVNGKVVVGFSRNPESQCGFKTVNGSEGG